MLSRFRPQGLTDIRQPQGVPLPGRSPPPVRVTDSGERVSRCRLTQTDSSANAFSLMSTTEPSIERSARLSALSPTVLPCTGAA